MYFFFFVFLFYINCSGVTLTEGGKQVKKYYTDGPTNECELMRRVESGRYYIGYDYEGARLQAETDLRNESAYYGGDTLIIDEIDTQNKQAIKMWGRAYRCYDNAKE